MLHRTGISKATAHTGLVVDIFVWIPLRSQAVDIHDNEPES